MAYEEAKINIYGNVPYFAEIEMGILLKNTLTVARNPAIVTFKSIT